MAVSRASLMALLGAHILFVWGMIGFLGEAWGTLIFCVCSSVPLVMPVLGIGWFLATLSPLLGIFALSKGRWVSQYLWSVAFSLFVFWLIQFLIEIRVTYCDSL